VTWTGHDLIELAGPDKEHTATAGAIYDPATGHWHVIRPIPNTVGLPNVVTAWTGRELFITSGEAFSWGPTTADRAQAALYDPVTNHWTFTMLPRQLDGMSPAGAAWTGRDVVLASVSHGRLSIGSFDPATGRWTMITPELPANHRPSGVTIVATPRRTLLWSAWLKIRHRSVHKANVSYGVDVLALGPDGRWTTVTGDWPQGGSVDSPVYGGGLVFGTTSIWCGMCSPPYVAPQPFLAAPATLARTVPTQAPLRLPTLWLWTGRAVIGGVIAGYGHSAPHGRLGPWAAWDPRSRHWYMLTGAAGHPALGATPLWAGHQLFALTTAGTLLTFRR
jgi:hypothetical protein